VGCLHTDAVPIAAADATAKANAAIVVAAGDATAKANAAIVVAAGDATAKANAAQAAAIAASVPNDCGYNNIKSLCFAAFSNGVTSTAITPGAAYSGNLLFPCELFGQTQSAPALGVNATSLTGTWRALGGDNTSRINFHATQFQRIA
jgi:hypothetical protein